MATLTSDGTKFATATKDGTVRVWSLGTRAPLGRSLVRDGNTKNATFIADGSKIATVGELDNVNVWDGWTGEHVETFRGYDQYRNRKPYPVPLLQSGNFLAVGGFGLRVIDLRRPADIGWVPKPLERAVIRNIGQGRSLNSIIVTCEHGLVTSSAWPSEDLQQYAQELDVVKRAEVGPRMNLKRFSDVAITDDGRLVASCSTWEGMQFWDVVSNRTIESAIQVESNFHTAAFDRTGRLLAAATSRLGTDRNSAFLCFLSQERVVVRKKYDHDTTVLCIAFRPDGKIVATGTAGGNVILWDTAGDSTIGSDMAHRSAVQDLTWQADGRHLIAAYRDGSLRVWDTELCVSHGAPMLQHSDVQRVEARGNDRVLSISRDGMAYLWWKRAPLGDGVKDLLKWAELVANGNDAGRAGKPTKSDTADTTKLPERWARVVPRQWAAAREHNINVNELNRQTRQKKKPKEQ